VRQEDTTQGPRVMLPPMPKITNDERATLLQFALAEGALPTDALGRLSRAAGDGLQALEAGTELGEASRTVLAAFVFTDAGQVALATASLLWALDARFAHRHRVVLERAIKYWCSQEDERTIFASLCLLRDAVVSGNYDGSCDLTSARAVAKAWLREVSHGALWTSHKQSAMGEPGACAEMLRALLRALNARLGLEDRS
jgi:hypothetical protein